MWISTALAHGAAGVETSMGFIMPVSLAIGALVYFLFFMTRKYAPTVIGKLFRRP